MKSFIQHEVWGDSWQIGEARAFGIEGQLASRGEIYNRILKL